jgi:hypothetical protein
VQLIGCKNRAKKFQGQQIGHIKSSGACSN